jgi:cation diffusion facilitator family transporter
MAEDEHSTGHILQSLAVNFAIASGKGVAAAFTHSGSMLAETLHSFSDCGNQLLLLVGVKRAKKPADEKHPLGHGMELYFWSFMVALMLFSGGGVFSIWEGIEKLREPEPVHHIGWGLAILGFSLVLEGWSTLSNLREMKKRRGSMGLVRYLHETKDSDLVVVFGENAAAVVGLVFASVALVAAQTTGDGRWDGAGSVVIGLVLVGVALFLAREIKSLLVGEAADEAVRNELRDIVMADGRFLGVLNAITIQQGPGEVMLACKLRPKNGIPSEELCRAIDEIERKVKQKVPSVKWSFVEPDLD